MAVQMAGVIDWSKDGTWMESHTQTLAPSSLGLWCIHYHPVVLMQQQLFLHIFMDAVL